MLVELYLNGPLTRGELAVSAGVSPATVSNLVDLLIRQGVLAEIGAEASDGGRPRGLLDVDPSYGHVVGVDVGETAVLVELFDLRLRAVASHTSRPDLGRLDPGQVVRQVLNGLERVLDESGGVQRQGIIGVGVGVPGLVEPGRDAVVHAPTVGWDAVPFGRLLRARTSLDLHFDNGAKALGQAESWFGAARDCDDAVVVLIGTGVGTSIITGGRLHRGPRSSAGEWGHTTVMVDGRPCRCGAAGCLEAYVGAPAVLSRYAELRGDADRPGDDLVARVTAVLVAGPEDAAAAQVQSEVATYLGAGIADLVNLFNPERVVVGGWLGTLLVDRLLPQIRAATSRHALRLLDSQMSIVHARLGADAVALGAATLPISSLLSSGAAVAQPLQAAGRGRLAAPRA